jgi:hypothetical protein
LAEFERLRQLLLGTEQARLDRHAERLDAAEEAEATLPRRLPELIEQATRQRGEARMAQALEAPVSIALAQTVRERPQTLVDALFPIIGPAIRRAIAEALRDFNEGFNRALESSFTPRGLGWRLEAWRSGLSYAQVVLQHTLTFHIDHLFLIERESGLVLHRESAPQLSDLDADAIAGMLTAIGDFVRDSVGGEGGSLASATVGEHLLWVIEGPRASLAAFLRGVPPPQLRSLLQQKLERLHAQLDDPTHALVAGAADPAAAFAEQLQLANLERSASALAEPPQRPLRRWPYVLLALLAMAAFATWGWKRYRWNTQVEALRTAIAAEPGYLVTALEQRPGREIVLHGARDPDARTPEAVLGARLPQGAVRTRFDFRPMLSADPRLVALRARRLLAPPPGVLLTVTPDGRLILRGVAPRAWVEPARERAAFVAGVSGVDASALEAAADPVQAARQRLRLLAERIAALEVGFVRDTEPADAAALDDLAAALREAVALATAARQRLRIEAWGSSDPKGNEPLNRRLRRARAQWLREALIGAGLDAALFLSPDEGAAPATLDRRAAGARLHLDQDDSAP